VKRKMRRQRLSGWSWTEGDVGVATVESSTCTNGVPERWTRTAAHLRARTSSADVS